MSKRLFSLIVLLSLGGCGKSARELYLSHLNGLSNQQLLSFHGTYQSGCQAFDFGGTRLFQKETLTFEKTTAPASYIQESTLYLDSTCSHELAIQSGRGTYRFENQNRELTLDATSLAIAPKEDTMTSAMNSQSFCGLRNWQKLAKKDLLKGTCGTQLKNARYFLDQKDAQVRSFDLILCVDAEMKNCAKATYSKI